jgi:hypothetical protein
MQDPSNKTEQHKLSPCEVEALKRCLEANKGDHSKCEKELAAFRTTCSGSAASNSSSNKKA